MPGLDSLQSRWLKGWPKIRSSWQSGGGERVVEMLAVEFSSTWIGNQMVRHEPRVRMVFQTPGTAPKAADATPDMSDCQVLSPL